MPDPSTATQSTPWFAVTPGAEGTGQSITSQRTALNEQTTGVANDLGGQNDDVTTALGLITTALNNKPGA
jgi:hypothetical protein